MISSDFDVSNIQKRTHNNSAQGCGSIKRSPKLLVTRKMMKFTNFIRDNLK